MSKKISIILCLSVLIILLASFIFYQLSLSSDLRLYPIAVKDLPGWKEADTRASLRAFLNSCQRLEKRDINRDKQLLAVSMKELYPACKAALTINQNSIIETKNFFENWFDSYQFIKKKPVKGLFTGYYVASLNGSLVKTSRFNVPIYGLPKDLVKINLSLFDSQWKNKTLYARIVNGKALPYPARAEIDQGKITSTTPVIAWTDSIVERLFLEIQGSGILNLSEGKQIFLNYAGQNGAKYTPIGRVLVDRGLMDKEKVSIQTIRAYLAEHSEQVQSILNENESFVFFKTNSQAHVHGVHNITLTPGYSLAVDPTWIPIGMPVWLDTTRPSYRNETNKKLQRLMIAQDVGGAIRGVVRGDVFWGESTRAAEIAGRMKNQGTYWLLLPRQVALSIQTNIVQKHYIVIPEKTGSYPQA